VSDLTADHVGWEVNVDDPAMNNAVRSIWLVGVGERKVRGELLVELRDELAHPGGVTLFCYAPETPCRVTRPFPRVRRRRRRAL
jgi:hypothetical protein